MRFLPHFALRDLFGWALALGVLVTLAALLPWELGEKADAFAPAYKDIKPEWYFMYLFQTLKLVPGGEIFGIEYEAFPVLLSGLAALALVLVPFLDRGRPGSRSGTYATWIGVVAVLYMVALTAWGYHSWVPVWIVVGTVVLLGVLALATGRRDEP
jgi:cytochrome b6